MTISGRTNLRGPIVGRAASTTTICRWRVTTSAGNAVVVAAVSVAARLHTPMNMLPRLGARLFYHLLSATRLDPVVDHAAARNQRSQRVRPDATHDIMWEGAASSRCTTQPNE